MMSATARALLAPTVVEEAHARQAGEVHGLAVLTLTSSVRQGSQSHEAGDHDASTFHLLAGRARHVVSKSG